MPRYQSADRREERARLFGELNRIHEAARGESRDLTAEERQEAERIETRFNEVSAEVRQLELLEGYSPEQRQRPPVNDDQRTGTRSEEQEAEYRQAFMHYARSGDASELRAAFATAPGANGGYAVPESWASSIRDILVDTGVIRRLADVQTTTTGNPFNMPVIATQATAGIRAEGGAIANIESEDTLDTVQIGAYEISGLVKANREFIRDGLNVEPWIQRRGGQVLGLKEGALFAVGTGGGSQPRGAVPNVTVGKTAASATAIAYADMVDLMFSVPGPYRVKGTWVCGDLTAASLMKLEDSEGHLIWNVNAQVGQPDTFLGKPIFTDPNIPGVATAQRSVVFGDWTFGYTIRVAGTLEMQVLMELFAGHGQIGFWFWEYVDSAVVDKNALKALLHP